MMINPLLRTEASIRRHLLSMMPVGTSMEEVIRTVENNESWMIRVVRDNVGVVLDPKIHVPTNMHPTERTKDEHIIGNKSIIAHLGTYSVIVRIDVVAFFAFNEDGELIEILIKKYYDWI